MTAKLDPVTLEVIRNGLPAIANEMAVDVVRTSYNMMIYDVRDFCTALLSPDGKIVAQNVGGVSHFVADLGVIVQDGMQRYGYEGFEPNDVIVTNHQRVAGQHLNNVVVYMPYFFKGELLMFSIVRAHWIDVGGLSTGFGGGGLVTDPWVEGLQLDQMKVHEAGKPNEVLLKIMRDNIRFPDASLGDLRSQIAGCRLAFRRLDELFHRYGKETIFAAIEQLYSETEAKCRHVVETIPDGVYEAESSVDGTGPDDPLRIHAKVTVTGGDMVIDLSGCAPQQKAGINSRSYAGAKVAYKMLTAPLDPVNEGGFGALEVIIPEGNIMMAQFPAVMTNWSMIIPTVVDTILLALAPAIPERIPAAHHGMLGGAVIFFGTQENGRPFMVQSIEGGGWGGRPHEDGESASVSICQGDVRNGTIEGIEMQNPVIVEERSMRIDSGGAGKFRGGLAIDIRIRNFIEGRWNLQGSNRAGCPPWGLWGGKEGAYGGAFLRMPQENDFKQLRAPRYLVPPECEVICKTGGGGGWGDPLDREPERVCRDVLDGYISRDAALSEYGVVLGENSGTYDKDATEKTRQERRATA